MSIYVWFSRRPDLKLRPLYPWMTSPEDEKKHWRSTDNSMKSDSAREASIRQTRTMTREITIAPVARMKSTNVVYANTYHPMCDLGSQVTSLRSAIRENIALASNGGSWSSTISWRYEFFFFFALIAHNNLLTLWGKTVGCIPVRMVIFGKDLVK